MIIEMNYDKDFAGYFSIFGLANSKFGKPEIPPGYVLVMNDTGANTVYNVRKS